MYIFLQIWKYGERDEQEAGGAGGEVCGYVLGYGNGAAATDYAIASVGASRGAGGWGTPGRAGDSEFDALASSGQAEKRGARECAAGKHVLALYGKHGSASGITAVSLFGMLHAEQSAEGRRYCGNLQIGEQHGQHGYQGNR